MDEEMGDGEFAELKVYLFRAGRAALFGFIAYCLLVLNPHYPFSHIGFSFVVLLMALTNRTQWLAEAVLAVLTLVLLIPPAAWSSLSSIGR